MGTDIWVIANFKETCLLAGTTATATFTKITQRLPVRIAIDPGQGLTDDLRPGMSVVVQVDTGSARE